MIAGGVTDGSIQLFPSSGNASYRSASVGLVLPPSAQCHADNHWSYAARPKYSFKGAHPAGEAITSVAFAKDGNMLISRGAEGTLKVWDIRNVKSVVKTFEGLETTTGETQVWLSKHQAFALAPVNRSLC
jgi:WD40 repeat protein